MFKKLAVLALWALLMGATCYGIEKNRVPENLKEVIAVHTVQPGETLWTIADYYYNSDAEFYNAFQHRVKAENAALVADGRFLQPGDKLYIRYYVTAGEN